MISGEKLVEGLEQTLLDVGCDYAMTIEEFGQVAASERRRRGEPFPLPEHVRGLVLALLSNQRPWRPIAQNMEPIEELFRGYDPDQLQSTPPSELEEGLRALRCGNRAVAKQMRDLAENIDMLRRLEAEFGALDRYVESAKPDAIASQLGTAGPRKLKQVGFTLAMEYLRNVGIRAAKPDVHVRRVLGGDRLGFVSGEPGEREAVELVDRLAREADYNPSYLDNLLWLFCATGYGEVCRAEPRCHVCRLREQCPGARHEGTKKARS